MTTDFDTWIAEYRAGIDADPELTPGYRSVLHAFTDFGAQHRAYPTGGTVDLWGFGTAKVMAQPVTGGWWVALHELIDPTGLSYPELQEAFGEELDSDSGDAAILEWQDPEDDTHHFIPLVRHDFVMRVFASRSPWRREFFENTADLMAHAVLHSGLAEQIGGVVRVATGPDGTTTVVPTGETLADVLRGDDLPSEEEARRRAWSGPAGALVDEHRDEL